MSKKNAYLPTNSSATRRRSRILRLRYKAPTIYSMWILTVIALRVCSTANCVVVICGRVSFTIAYTRETANMRRPQLREIQTGGAAAARLDWELIAQPPRRRNISAVIQFIFFYKSMK